MIKYIKKTGLLKQKLIFCFRLIFVNKNNTYC